MRNYRKKSHNYDKIFESISTRVILVISAWSTYGLLVIGIILTLSLLRNISTIMSANATIAETKNRLENLKAENEKLSKEVQMIQSPDYKETQAREKLGLAKPGETVLVLPEAEIVKQVSPITQNEEKSSLPLPNWQKWLKLFL